MDTPAFIADLLPEEEGPLSDVVRTRFTESGLNELDQLVAFFCGQGHRGVNRSVLIRKAVRTLTSQLLDDFPEARNITIQD